MTDSAPSSGAHGLPLAADGNFHIRKIYAKDISFETPNSPAVFASEWEPDTDINLRTEAAKISAEEYEVTLTVTATVKVGENTAYLAEVQQGGVFSIVGMTSLELDVVLGAYCPAVLYPYAREMISDLVIRGGFPSFVLAPVNFDALHAKKRGDAKANATAAKTAG